MEDLTNNFVDGFGTQLMLETQLIAGPELSSLEDSLDDSSDLHLVLA